MKFYDLTQKSTNKIPSPRSVSIRNCKYGTALNVEQLDENLDTGFFIENNAWHAWDLNGNMTVNGYATRQAMIMRAHEKQEWI